MYFDTIDAIYISIILYIYIYVKQFFTQCRAAGDGLVELFHSDPVQSFFYGATQKELNPNKLMYQPGTLRKVLLTCVVICILKNISPTSYLYDNYIPRFR